MIVLNFRGSPAAIPCFYFRVAGRGGASRTTCYNLGNLVYQLRKFDRKFTIYFRENLCQITRTEATQLIFCHNIGAMIV